MEYILNLEPSDIVNNDIPVEISNFPDGQHDVKILAIPSNLTPSDHVIIRSRMKSWIDLELIVAANAALRRNVTSHISLYIPYLLGARSDRQFTPFGNSYLVDVIAPVINMCKFSRVSIYDPHSDVAAACINKVHPINNIEFVEDALKNYNYEDVILVSPDAGAYKKIFSLATNLGFKGEILTCSKYRNYEGQLTLRIPELTEENKKKTFVIIDDICDGGRTFIQISEMMKDIPKENKVLIVSHGIFSNGFIGLKENFDTIYTTNSYYQGAETDYLRIYKIY